MLNVRNYAGTGGTFGQGAYDRAIAAGMSDGQIRSQLAGSGLTIGPVMQQRLSAPYNPAASSLAIQQFAGSGGTFGQGAYDRARAAGLTDPMIQARLANSGLMIGSGIQQRFGIDDRGLPPGIKGRFADAGSGAYYNTRGVATDTHGVVYAAGPMDAARIRAFLANRPSSEWVLPASAGGPGQPYTPPSGVRAVAPVGMGGAGGGSYDRGLSIPAYTESRPTTLGQQASPAARRTYPMSKTSPFAAQGLKRRRYSSLNIPSA